MVSDGGLYLETAAHAPSQSARGKRHTVGPVQSRQHEASRQPYSRHHVLAARLS